MRMYVYMYVCTYILYIRMYLRTCVCMNVHPSIHTYVHAYVYTSYVYSPVYCKYVSTYVSTSVLLVSFSFYRCKPAYVNFHFLNKPSLRTSGVPQGSSLRWNEARVLLLGTIDSGILLEYLRGPLLVLEVHDRDLKENKEGRKPALFGSEQGDSALGTTAFMAGTSLRHNPFCGREDLFNPYGVATIDLSELLNGQTYHEFTSQIQRGPRRPAADVQAFRMLSTHTTHIICMNACRVHRYALHIHMYTCFTYAGYNIHYYVHTVPTYISA